jgi:hypothetical protein
LVPFTNIVAWFTRLSALMYWLAPFALSLIVQVAVPVPVACCSVEGM